MENSLAWAIICYCLTVVYRANFSLGSVCPLDTLMYKWHFWLFWPIPADNEKKNTNKTKQIKEELKIWSTHFPWIKLIFCSNIFFSQLTWVNLFIERIELIIGIIELHCPVSQEWLFLQTNDWMPTYISILYIESKIYPPLWQLAISITH